jgi:hypothetical protein
MRWVPAAVKMTTLSAKISETIPSCFPWLLLRRTASPGSSGTTAPLQRVSSITAHCPHTARAVCSIIGSGAFDLYLGRMVLMATSSF